jgi:hypothetical protein
MTTNTSTCERQAEGAVDLYFYDELTVPERADVEAHLRVCGDCRQALAELSVIRAALAQRPDVDGPAGGDWSPFMRRLDDAVRLERRAAAAALADSPMTVRAESPVRTRSGVHYAPYLAMAALLTLVTSSMVYVARTTSRPAVEAPSGASGAAAQTDTDLMTAATGLPRSPEAGFAALSEQHFERSKLVVLGLANKDPRDGEAEWAYERGLASSLLSDTRLYRLAAEDRGMRALAGVMGDLELVLLQTALAEDGEALAQIQRLIHKRDLVTKMDVAAAGS